MTCNGFGCLNREASCKYREAGEEVAFVYSKKIDTPRNRSLQRLLTGQRGSRPARRFLTKLGSLTAKQPNTLGAIPVRSR